MNALTDQQLLRDYTEHRSEAAFAEFVRRHIDLVYSAARRMVCDPHLAEDVTQGVFVAFAQNARQLSGRPVLSGWLHRTAQNLAAKAVRTDVRRRTREQEAAAMNELLSTESDAAWDQIAPQLDAALGELNEPDRDALFLRYFEKKSAREMALALGISDEAAQKRVSRAVERLREFFTKRGITVGASGLATLVSANAVQAAPVGLVLTISTAALAGTTIATTATATATKAFAMTTLQKTIVTATVAVLAGVGVYEARQASHWRARIQAIQQESRPLPASSNEAALLALQGKLDVLAAQNAALTNALAQANADNTRLEMEREQAKRAAALFKELADQANSKDTNPTNAYPTARHVWAAFGKMGRLAALAKQDDSTLSPEEKSALEAARMKAFDDLPNLVKAAKQLDAGNSSEGDLQSDELMDKIACLLYGALNLDEQQFNEVYGVMEKIGQEAKQKGLSKETPAPEAAEAIKQIMEQWKAETQTLLTPEQARIFAEVVTHMQVQPGNLGFNFDF
jgi:RNA polymerase sigma factor (sigma-70 family)